jgi:TusA-related sulfurtransferase
MTIEAAGLPTFRAVGDAHGRVPAREAGERLVGAIAARDYGRIFDVLARDARLRYLIPSGPGQIAGAADVAAKYFEWFGDVIELEVQETLVERVSDRTAARYRFLLRKGPQWTAVEQQAYLDTDADGRIAAIDLLCSGFRPTNEPGGASSAGEHEFDAGTMGCADGLAAEFRRRIGAIPVGDVLVVTARDPAAKEDLPPLARLLGHTVHSVVAPGDGRLVITVERGR